MKKLQHQVLNAKLHQKEAEVVTAAGQAGTVTIATNMAGRGTDIQLGGNLNYFKNEKEIQGELSLKEKNEVKKNGGLFVIGTERHESRRIDNQLRGRSGRQGDPGETQFYVSMDDSLMRIFAPDSMRNIMKKLKLPEDQPIQNSLITRSLENAQTKIEGFNFDARKHLLEFDSVLNIILFHQIRFVSFYILLHQMTKKYENLRFDCKNIRK